MSFLVCWWCAWRVAGVGVRRRVHAVVESGLYDYWLHQGIPNASACDNAPSKVTVHQPFDLASLWVSEELSGAAALPARRGSTWKTYYQFSFRFDISLGRPGWLEDTAL